jgi:hypothetical protein
MAAFLKARRYEAKPRPSMLLLILCELADIVALRLK